MMGLASCVYLGTAHEGAGFSSQLDAVGKSVEMTSGVLVADMIEGTKFALGATMAVRKQELSGCRRDLTSWGSFMPMTLCWATGWRRRARACGWRRM
jgi:hypothetical protein